MRFSYRDFRLHLGPPTANLTVRTANPFFVSPIGATSETVAYSFISDLPPPLSVGSAETFTSTIGGTLRLNGGWRSSAYVGFGAETDRNRSTGLINSSFLNEALGSTADNPATSFSTAANGFFNPFAGQPGANAPAVLAFIGSGRSGASSRDQVVSGNIQADGPLWRLPAGDMKLALGVDVRRETLLRASYNFVSGIAPTPSAPTDLSRTVSAVYAELEAPLVGPDNARPGMQALDLSLAGRIEHYPAFGTTSNPKVGVMWRPVNDLTLRATYGTSFRAPELRELSDPAVNAETLLPLNGGRITTMVLIGGNPDLRPETARSWTVGADFRPKAVPGLAMSLSWFDIRFSNRIGRPVAANLVGALTDPTLASFVQRISPNTNAADLALITALVNSPQTSTLGGLDPPTAFGAIADERYVNTAALTTSGLDGLITYGFDLGADRVNLSGNATYMVRYDQQLTPTTATVNEVNVANFPLRIRGRATADWTHGWITGGVAVNYMGGYHDPLGASIRSQATVDLQLRTAAPDRGPWRGLTAALNIRNLFDRAPPFYDNPFGLGFDPSNGDPIGRFVSLQLTRVW
jgi:iron complex outermembrane receptor protein